jgi:hypothetical protein
MTEVETCQAEVERRNADHERVRIYHGVPKRVPGQKKEHSHGPQNV